MEDAEYGQTPPGSTYEHTDANIWIVVKFMLWLAVSAVVIDIGLGLLYALLIKQSVVVSDQPYPLAATPGERLPPVPRLQQFPRNELYEFRVGEESVLERYGWLNKQAGIVHIPIEDAMRRALERGLLQTRSGPVRPENAPGLMPSDASSGRTMERRRQ